MSENYFDDEVFFQSDQEIKQQKNTTNKLKKNSHKQSQNVYRDNAPYPQQLSKQKTGLNYLMTPKSKYASILRNINQEEVLSSSNVPDSMLTYKIQSNNNILDLNKESVDNGSKNLDKKERNKQAAKNSRDRKKIYIQILEERKREKQRMLASKKKELEEANAYYEKLVSQNRTMSNFAASRHQLIKRLQLLLDKNQKLTQKESFENLQLQKAEINTEINEIIDNLRSRIGATGKQRINTINQYFQQIINLSLPALHRYLMWSASENKHLFSANQEKETEQQEWFKELKNSLNLTEQQKRQIQDKQGFLEEQKLILEQLIEELKSVKDDIEKKSLELDDLIDEIRKILTPIQCAYFIIFIEKNKYRKELNLCSEGPNIGNSFKEGYEHPMRKIVKKQQ